MGILSKLRRAIVPPPDPSTAAAAPERDPHTHGWTEGSASGRSETYNRHKPAIKDSPDLDRIIALPRREPVNLETPNPTRDVLVEIMTERLACPPGTPCVCLSLGRECITRLKPAQAWALYEAPLVGGLMSQIGVGHGKTGIDILLPLVMPNCRLAVVLLPPNLQDQFKRDFLAWSQHFRVPSLVIGQATGMIYPGRPVLHVVPYSIFSRPQSTDLLEQLRPDLIIGDEGHKLRHRETAGTARLLRYLVAHPETRFCTYSGTITAKSLKDYGHLARFALRERSPLPIHPNVLEEWATAIDPPLTGNSFPAPRGALEKLALPNEDLYSSFRRRLSETTGVTMTKEGAIDASIMIHERKAPEVPTLIRDHLHALRTLNIRPDGEEFIDELAVSACARQLASGFFYRWRYPRGEPEPLIDEWFAARKAWHKELRERLKVRIEHLDSPLLAWNAALRAHGLMENPNRLPEWKAEAFLPWREIRDRVQPEPEAVWCSDYLAEDAAAWAVDKGPKGVVWYDFDAFGKRVAAIAKVPLHGGGPDAGERIAAETGRTAIVCSIKSHGTGRDGLQRLFYRFLIANPPSSGDMTEQLLGRGHRPGQPADEVEHWYYRHTAEYRAALDTARTQARYIQGTTGAKQKLLLANYTFPLDDSA